MIVDTKAARELVAELSSYHELHPATISVLVGLCDEVDRLRLEAEQRGQLMEAAASSARRVMADSEEAHAEIERLRAENDRLMRMETERALCCSENEAESARLRGMIMVNEYVTSEGDEGCQPPACPECERPANRGWHEAGCAWGAVCDEARRSK
jgi:hypothetical protein